MSIFFTAAGRNWNRELTLPNPLNTGLAQMKFYGGGADEGDRTMIDALQPA